MAAAAAAEAADAAPNQADGPEAPWSYRNILALAPMVRVNTLPFRLLAREYGANIVYSEELVDRSVVQCRRSENAALGTIDFRHESGKLIFSTVPHERVAFQLGTASAGDALRAAQVVCADVRAIDINMGCPVKFSVQGGMGAALLSKPERVKDILGTLVRNLPGVPVTCKIRLLDSAHDTLQLARAIQETGVAALAVHGRRRNDRPRWWAQWDQVALLRQQLGSELPLLPNGDIFLPEHMRGAREATGCDSLMLARGAMWNASLFGAPEAELRPQREVVARYVALCRRYDTYLGSGLRLGLGSADPNTSPNPNPNQVRRLLWQCQVRDHEHARGARQDRDLQAGAEGHRPGRARARRRRDAGRPGLRPAVPRADGARARARPAARGG